MTNAATALRFTMELATPPELRKKYTSQALVFSRTSPARVPFGAKPGNGSIGWVSKAVQTVESFCSLQTGWDGYSAEPPKEIARYYAQDFLYALSGSNMEPKRIAPSSVGGVGITIKRNDRKAYLEFYNDGATYVLFAGKDAEPITRAVRPENNGFRDLVNEIRQYLNA